MAFIEPPLATGPFPIETPLIGRLEISQLRDIGLDPLKWITPIRSSLSNEHVMILYFVTKTNSFFEIDRRAAFTQSANFAFDSLKLLFGKRHCN